MTRIAHAVVIERVSSERNLGDSHEDQGDQIDNLIQRVELKDNVKIHIIDTFPLTQSAQVEQELQPLWLKLQEFKKMNPKPEYAFVKSVDRSQRHSGEMMLFLYDMYQAEGIKLVDVYGVLQDYSFNTLEHTGFEYKWSKKNPARKMIYMEGERAHEDVQDQLTRMIGASIRFVKYGYAVGSAPYGLKNIEARTEHGKRKVWSAKEEESRYVVRILEFTLEGLRDDEIIKKINEMGYKSRIENVYDKNDPKKVRVIGTTGGNPLNQKELDRIRQNPAYAGIMKHEWLKNNKADITRYIKAKHFSGLITVQMWNKINEGRLRIIDTGDEIRVVDIKKDLARAKQDHFNPIVPFRGVIRCPIKPCNKMLSGSAPRNGSGEHTRTYHHQWQHDYYGINADKLEEQIYKFLDKIEFRPRYANSLRKKILHFWEIKRERLIDDSVDVATRIKANAFQQQQLKDTIKGLTIPKVRSEFENDMNNLLLEEEDLKQLQNTKHEEKVDVQAIINKVMYYLEHVGEIVKNEPDIQKKQILFALVFEELPTVDNLYFRTASNLACIFRQKTVCEPTVQTLELWAYFEKAYNTLEDNNIIFPTQTYNQL